MELNTDWRSFDQVFRPRRRNGSPQAALVDPSARPVYVVTDGARVVSAYAEGEDCTGWIGGDLAQLSESVKPRPVLPFPRANVDNWVFGSLALPHFYDQMEFLREKSGRAASRSHFLLDALHSKKSWWTKVLPSSYGVLIRLESEEGAIEQDFFMVIRRGRVDLFQEPDLSALGAERSRQSIDVVKYLSEKHLVPVQGVQLAKSEWNLWNEAERSQLAWRKVAVSIKESRARLVPFRWSLVTLVATRGFLNF